MSLTLATTITACDDSAVLPERQSASVGQEICAQQCNVAVNDTEFVRLPLFLALGEASHSLPIASCPTAVIRFHHRTGVCFVQRKKFFKLPAVEARANVCHSCPVRRKPCYMLAPFCSDRHTHFQLDYPNRKPSSHACSYQSEDT